MKRFLVLSALFFSILPALGAGPSGASAGAGSSKLRAVADGSRVEFLAVGRPNLIKIRGTSTRELRASLQWNAGKLLGSFDFRLDTLDTGIARRDEHMKDKYLEVSKHPVATLELAPLAISYDVDQPFEGTLDLHGTRRPVSGTVRFSRGPDAPGFSADASFRIRLQDFGMEIPKFAGITVAEDVELKVRTKVEVVQ